MLHRLGSVVASLFPALGQSLKELNCSSKYLIDSFPVAVCRNVRINRCKLLTNEAYRGYNASKREYFYGFKVEDITTAQGVPVDYFIVAGSMHDARAFEAMDVDLPAGSSLYADSAYTNCELEDLYLECDPQRKSNSKRKDTPAMAFVKKDYEEEGGDLLQRH